MIQNAGLANITEILYNGQVPILLKEIYYMPRMCSACGKTYSKTIKRSHSMRASIVRLKANLQWTRDVNGNRVKACTRCMKAVNKKAITA